MVGIKEVFVIRWLVDFGVVVISVGGGGVLVIEDVNIKVLKGVEVVIDKDFVS